MLSAGAPIEPVPDTYAPQNWYIYRYQRFSNELQTSAKEAEKKYSVQIFIPLIKQDENKRSAPIISSYIFVRTTAALARTIGNALELHPWRKTVDGIKTTDYVTIPDIQMNLFIRAVESKQKDITLVDSSVIDYEKDDVVRITEGEMKGAIGYLKSTPRSKNGKIIITLTQDADAPAKASAPNSLSFTINVSRSQVEIVRYANNDHLHNLMKRIRPVIDDAMHLYRTGEIIPQKTITRLQAYINTISATTLSTQIQRDNNRLNLYRIHTILEHHPEAKTLRQEIESDTLPTLSQRPEARVAYQSLLTEADTARQARKASLR